MTIEITTAAKVLAQLRARNAVKAELRKHGHKVSNYSAKEISSWANLFLDDHHDALMPEAIARAKAMILRGALGKRAQRALCAELASAAQTTEPQKSTTSTVQMLGAK